MKKIEDIGLAIIGVFLLFATAYLAKSVPFCLSTCLALSGLILTGRNIYQFITSPKLSPEEKEKEKEKEKVHEQIKELDRKSVELWDYLHHL